MKVEGRMEVIELSKTLDLVAASALLESFLQKKGQAVQIDADQVHRLGAQCLQILLSAKKTWEADDYSFSLENPSAEFAEAIALMGVSIEDLTYHAQDSHREE